MAPSIYSQLLSSGPLYCSNLSVLTTCVLESESFCICVVWDNNILVIGYGPDQCDSSLVSIAVHRNTKQTVP